MKSTKGNIFNIFRFRIRKSSSNDNEKNHIVNVFHEIMSAFKVINTEPLLNAFVKEKLIYINYEVKILGKRIPRRKE